MSDLLNSASLVMIPSGYKEDVVYSQIPTDGSGDLSFTRASNGTRINSAGLVEDCPWNLVQFSEDFSNAIWVKSRTTITSNATNAPNGTLTADKFIATSASGVHTISQSGFASEAYSFSVYAKAGEETVISLWLRSAAVGATFDLSAGTVSNITVTSATITDVGDGWYRCFVYDSTPGTTANIYGRTGSSYVGNGVDGFFIWGAQLNIGSTAKPYFPTTDRLNVPRLTYQNGGGGCPSLLLEPQRTNLALRSEEFDNAIWLKLGGSSVTPNTTTAPDGNLTADTLSLTTNASSSVAQAIVFATTTTITISVYAKVASGTKDFRLRTDNPTTTQSFTATTSWQRFSMTATPTGNTSAYVINDLAGTAGDLFIWGFQVEVGAYPTTYIPTTSATATRVADSFSRNNIYTNGLITSSGGTWFVELRNNVAMTRDTSEVGLFIGNSSNGTSGDVLAIRNNGTGRLSITKRISGTQTGLIETTTTTTKIAIKWNGTTADVFENGTKQVSATAFATTNMEFFNGSGGDVTKFIQQMALFPTPLSDTDCTTLTTL